jgi:hypothetical protein
MRGFAAWALGFGIAFKGLMVFVIGRWSAKLDRCRACVRSDEEREQPC